MTTEDIKNQLAKYGYTITTEGNFIVTPSGKVTGVKLAIKRGRIRASAEATGVLWTGVDVGKFLVSFWYAKPL